MKGGEADREKGCREGALGVGTPAKDQAQLPLVGAAVRATNSNYAAGLAGQ